MVAMTNSPTSDIVGDDVSFSVYKYLFCLCPLATCFALILLNNPFGKYFALRMSWRVYELCVDWASEGLGHGT